MGTTSPGQGTPELRRRRTDAETIGTGMAGSAAGASPDHADRCGAAATDRRLKQEPDGAVDHTLERRLIGAGLGRQPSNARVRRPRAGSRVAGAGLQVPFQASRAIYNGVLANAIAVVAVLHGVRDVAALAERGGPTIGSAL